MNFVPARCIVFDIDDTLYLERDYARSGFDAVGLAMEVELGVAGFGTRAWQRFEAGTRGTIFDDVLADLGVPVDDALIGWLVQVYREHEPAISMLPDARRMVDTCADAFLGVVTDGPLESQRAKARALEVDGWSSLTIFTSEWGAEFGKPHRRAFELVEEVSGLRGPTCVYVADNPHKDFAAPRALGWRTVRVRRAGSLHERVASGDDVDLEVTDLAPAPALLEQLTDGRR